MPSPLQIDLEHLSPVDVAACSAHLLTFPGAQYRQDVANRLVDFLYENFRHPATNEPASVLVRCFQTCSYALLPLEYRDAADRLFEHISSQPDMRCLSLLATRGAKKVWNDPSTSIAHQAIPLPSAEVVRRAPMVARLLEQLKIPVEHVASQIPAELHLEDLPDAFNIFHIAEAKGSPYIPAQVGFIEPFGVRSVLGMGGILPSGDVLAVILFTRVPISRDTALQFGTLAPAIKQLLSPFDASHAFAHYR